MIDNKDFLDRKNSWSSFDPELVIIDRNDPLFQCITKMSKIIIDKCAQKSSI